MQQYRRIIFSLCQVDAWLVQNSVSMRRTVLFPLPGQSCNPCLLPLIQMMFVHECHIFVYNGACHYVKMGMVPRNQDGVSYWQIAKKGGVG